MQILTCVHIGPVCTIVAFLLPYTAVGDETPDDTDSGRNHDLVIPESAKWKSIKASSGAKLWLVSPATYCMVTTHRGDTVVPLNDVDKLREFVRKKAAALKGGIIEARYIETPKGKLPYYIIKNTYKNLMGYRYIGTTIFPFEGGYHELRLDTMPVGPTGARESLLTVKLNLYDNAKTEPIPENALPTPGPANTRPGATRIVGWFKDPYDPAFDASANYTVTDDERYDEMFPTHSLSRLRKQLPKLVESATTGQSSSQTKEE